MNERAFESIRTDSGDAELLYEISDWAQYNYGDIDQERITRGYAERIADALSKDNLDIQRRYLEKISTTIPAFCEAHKENEANVKAATALRAKIKQILE